MQIFWAAQSTFQFVKFDEVEKKNAPAVFQVLWNSANDTQYNDTQHNDTRHNDI